jgi:hypothetical protein
MKMNRIVLVFLFFFTSLLLSYRVEAGDIYNSVTEFGAKGDGVTDDTEAIQRAINASNNKQNSVINIQGVYSGPIYFGNTKTVYFPAGLYKISKPLVVGPYVSMKGDKAVLLPDVKYKAKSIAVSGPISWLTKIEGIQFVGFSKALYIANNNTDCGKVEIENCDFLSNDTSIQVNTPSSFLIINNNRFINNQKAAVIWAQKADMSDNWITSGTLKGLHDAQIITIGVLHFDKNLLVPTNPAPGAIEPAWINNYASVIIEGTRQGGEPGSFTLVNNFAPANIKPFWPSTVIIKTSECYAVYGNEKGYFQPAALRLIEVPNNIVLEDLVGFIDAGICNFSRVKNPLTALNKVNQAEGSVIYKIRVQNIQGPGTQGTNESLIPEALARFWVK